MIKKTIKKDSKSRLDAIGDHYDESGSRIIHDSQYVGYGTLIALFSFGKNDFFVPYKTLAILTSVFAILSLIFIYVFMIYVFTVSSNTLKLKKELSLNKNDLEEVIENKYQKMRTISMRIFWTVQFFLFLSILFFIISSSCYFGLFKC